MAPAGSAVPELGLVGLLRRLCGPGLFAIFAAALRPFVSPVASSTSIDALLRSVRYGGIGCSSGNGIGLEA